MVINTIDAITCDTVSCPRYVNAGPGRMPPCPGRLTTWLKRQ